MKKNHKTYTARFDKELAMALEKRLKELGTDYSKYVRKLILSEIIMKSQNTNSLKSLLN